MSDPYLGEIRNFAFNYAPYGWLQCQGQLLPIQQNEALFTLLGVTYGGNGSQNFGIPDLRGRAPIGIGTGLGLTAITQGQMSGQNTVTINSMQLPSHNHSTTFATGTPAVTVTIQGSNAQGNSATPGGNYIAGSVKGSSGVGNGDIYISAPTPTTLGNIAGATASIAGTVPTSVTGGNQPIPTQPPFLGSNWCIATQGVFPPRP